MCRQGGGDACAQERMGPVFWSRARAESGGRACEGRPGFRGAGWPTPRRPFGATLCAPGVREPAPGIWGRAWCPLLLRVPHLSGCRFLFEEITERLEAGRRRRTASLGMG